MTHIMFPKRGRKAFDALREAGASLVRTWDDGGQRWDFPDGRNACVVTPSGTLYVRKAGTDIALAADPNVTRTYDDGGVAYHVGISTPGVGGGGRPAARAPSAPAACRHRSPTTASANRAALVFPPLRERADTQA